MQTKSICAICAYRATCQKKFSISGKDISCPDFAKDISIKEEPEEVEKSEDNSLQKG